MVNCIMHSDVRRESFKKREWEMEKEWRQEGAGGALVYVLYLCALPVSETLRLTKPQFRIEVEKQRVKVVGILLSKRKEY